MRIKQVDILEDFKPLNLIFKSYIPPSNGVNTYMMRLPKEMEERIKENLISQYGEKVKIEILPATITVTL